VHDPDEVRVLEALEDPDLAHEARHGVAVALDGGAAEVLDGDELVFLDVEGEVDHTCRSSPELLEELEVADAVVVVAQEGRLVGLAF